MAKGKHAIARMVITPAENGGHTVEHHFKAEPTIRRGRMGGGFDSGYVEPESHTFGPKDGEMALAHIRKHLGISEAREEADEEKISPGIHKKVAKMEAAKDEY